MNPDRRAKLKSYAWLAALTMLLALAVPLASAGAQDTGPDGDQLSAQEVAEAGGTLDATPESVTNLVDETITATTPDQEHTIDVAVADDGEDADDEDVTVYAQVEDPEGDTSYDGGLPDGTTNNSECNEGDTGEECQVTLSGALTESGKDRIRVFRDDNGDGEWQEGEDFDWVNKTWTDPSDEADAERLGGRERIETAQRISQEHWLNEDGSEFEAASHVEQEQAQHVVIARAGDFEDGRPGFADALAGAPLAVLQEGPLLLTFPDELHERTEDELQRVLATDDDEDVDVYILGNEQALSAQIEDDVEDLGYDVMRIGGQNRIETAVDIADHISELQGELNDLLIASGEDFPDAMVGGAAAANVDESGDNVGAVLLTWEQSRPVELTDYLAEFSDETTATHALGGTGVNPYACNDLEVDETIQVCDDTQDGTEEDELADIVVFGGNRIQTSRAVAEFFFDGPVDVGVARADLYPDSLTGGAHIGQYNGPIVITWPENLDPQAERYLCHTADTIEHAFVYGGDQAVSDVTFTGIDESIDGADCDPFDLPGRAVERA